MGSFAGTHIILKGKLEKQHKIVTQLMRCDGAHITYSTLGQDGTDPVPVPHARN